uniref:O-antigen export system ATP-binding protein rfbB n=1 Tax=Magnetococcus massalia (strain MO-1) TaxID=451514 RepID=A0A1S7LPR9_MAGMO|nr:O-antigen export system ATP-binding protein rfbB [Candidatus Magnetococcus massalia]
MAEQPLIQVDGLWKRYGLPLLPAVKRSFKRIQGKNPDEATTLPWSLQRIQFESYAGETLGIAGLNGSGKSTLLKVLAGVTPPTRGRVTVSGPLFPMIELNAGIHMELTGRENIYLLGAVLGLTRQEINARMPEIEAFCELGEWLDRPVRMYSSGMMVRLGFGTGIHVSADILLMDEVMAVGDLSFYNKCLAHLENLRERGKCTLFVSHNIRRMRRMCDRVLVLNQGEQVFIGPTEEAMTIYEDLVRKRSGQNMGQGGQFDFIGAALESIAFEQSGENELVIPQGGDATLAFTLRLDKPIGACHLNIALESLDSVDVVVKTLEIEGAEAGLYRFEVAWQNLMMKPDMYGVRLGINMGHTSGKGFRARNAARLIIEGEHGLAGLYNPTGEITMAPLEQADGAAS